MPLILALDLGTQMGWAKGDVTETKPWLTGMISGTQSFALGRYDGGGMRFLRFQEWLDEVLDFNVQRVAYEEVRRHMGVDAAHVYGGLQAILTGHCERRDIPYEAIPVQTIKKHVTGKGNAGKTAVLAKVRELGYRPVDDNEADAIALWLLMAARHGGKTSPSTSGRSKTSLPAP